MYKADHDLVADAIHKARERVMKGDIGIAFLDYAIINLLMDALEEDNPQFDRARFSARAYL